MARERRFKGGELPTSSMADIAFLLLIFFLVTTTIDMDKGLGMVLPAEGEELEINKKNILNNQKAEGNTCYQFAVGCALLIKKEFFDEKT